MSKLKLKELLSKYKHAWVLLYVPIYFIWFFALEKAVTTDYYSVHIWLDDYIPFNELFVIPYYIWFPYIVITIAYFFITSRKEFYKCTAFLFTGMTICLIIYTIWPNGQDLRPSVYPRNNFLINIVRHLQTTDTPTNVCPSIHVFNSIGAHIAIVRSEKLKKYKWITITSFIIMVLICMATVFLKQHSVFDGICAVILAAILYLAVYVPDYSKVFGSEKKAKEDCQFE